MPDQPIHAKMLIDGQWEDGRERADVHNPADPDEIAGTACGEPPPTLYARLPPSRPRSRLGRVAALSNRPSFSTKRSIASPAKRRPARG